MVKLILILLAALTFGCGAHQEGVVATRADRIEVGNNNKIANLERAARYPWRDNGHCAVQESSGDWATLVERCYDALDLHRIRFVDSKRACPIAQAGAISANEATRLVGMCLLVQPELLGVVIVVGVVVVAAAIVVELQRAKKPGCYCRCFDQGVGPYVHERVENEAICAVFCRKEHQGYQCGGPVKWF